MRETWTFHTAGQILFGRNAVRQVGEIAGRLGAKRVFLVTFQSKQERLECVIPHAKYVVAQYGDKVLLSNLPGEEMFGRNGVADPAVLR